MNNWHKVTDKSHNGKKVILFYKNSMGMPIKIMAKCIEKFKEEAPFDSDYTDYNEENDTFYIPEGWYEVIDNWDEYVYIAVIESAPTHWMFLPNDPL